MNLDVNENIMITNVEEPDKYVYTKNLFNLTFGNKNSGHFTK